MKSQIKLLKETAVLEMFSYNYNRQTETLTVATLTKTSQVQFRSKLGSDNDLA